MATNAEIIRSVAKKTKVSQRTIHEVLDAAETALKEALLSGEYTEIKVLDTWYSIVNAPARKLKNIVTGEIMDIPERKTIKLEKSVDFKRLFKE